MYLAFQVLDYALLSAPGAPLKKALVDAGIGKDIMGSYDNGIYQPIFSIIAKNANLEQKEEFLSIVERTLSEIVKKGMDTKALEQVSIIMNSVIVRLILEIIQKG